MVNVHGHHFDLYKLPKSKLTNADILCLVQFGSGRNKLVQLLLRSRNSGGRTVQSLLLIIKSSLNALNVMCCSEAVHAIPHSLGVYVIGLQHRSLLFTLQKYNINLLWQKAN